jgi:DNA-binding NtrC family response regulator
LAIEGSLAVNKVLILDSKEKLIDFDNLIGEVPDMSFIYTENLHQALEHLKNEDIQVILLGSDINGSIVELLPSKIEKEIGKEVEVILNCFKQDTCKIKKELYLKGDLIDIIYPKMNKDKIIEKIKVALEVRRLNSIRFLEESEA